MKKVIYRLFILTTCVFFIFYMRSCFSRSANSVCSRTGSITVCGEGILDELTVAGKATLQGTTILGDTHVAGMFDAEHGSLNTLQVAGKATLNAMHVKGQLKMSGLLNARDSQFDQPIIIASDKTYFNHSILQDIHIEPGGDRQILCLGNQTVVNGDVFFTSGQGMVGLDSSSKILGRVEGGVVNQNYFNTYCKGDE